MEGQIGIPLTGRIYALGAGWDRIALLRSVCSAVMGEAVAGRCPTDSETLGGGCTLHEGYHDLSPLLIPLGNFLGLAQ